MEAGPAGAGSSHPVLAELRGALVASCQPVPGGAFDAPELVALFARAVAAGGARGLRIEGIANLRAVRAAVALPVIGLVKRDLDGHPVRITPLPADARALAEAGAGIVAFAATARSRPASVAELAAAVHGAGALAMADCATLEEARAALAAGADVVATTMSGYAGPGAPPEEPDLPFLRAACAELGAPVFAEGRFNTPALAAEAMRAGAHAVVVGSAITRPEVVASWFAAAVAAAGPGI
jgi:putative N-acetylmannosamine-6-phosphate epimerase